MGLVNVVPRKPEFHRIVEQSFDGDTIELVVESLSMADNVKREELTFLIPSTDEVPENFLVLRLGLNSDTGWILKYTTTVEETFKTTRNVTRWIEPE